MDKLRDTYQIDILESLLQSILGLIWHLTLNNLLMLVGNMFGQNTYRFAYGEVVIFVFMH